MAALFRLAIAAAISMAALPASAQQVSRCASCHFANLDNIPAAAYLSDWAESPHARHGVSCDRCHGGDPWSDHPSEAHRGILNPSVADSPVNAANLAGTCATCHRGQADAFGMSRHQALAIAGDERGPTCTTCHTAMRARRPSPSALESRCAACHPAGSPRGTSPAAIRASLETLDALRVRCDRLEGLAKNIRDANDRLTVSLAIEAARVTIAEGAAAAHTFSAPNVNERNVAAARLLDAVAESLSVAR